MRVDFFSGCVCGRSYDLDLDNKLSEETTVLVENYTVRPVPLRSFCKVGSTDISTSATVLSYPTDE